MRAFLFAFFGSVMVAGAVVSSAACTAPGDASVDPTPTTCERSAYRIESVGLPRTGNEAAGLAFDLDGDGTTDNRLGRLNATLASFFSDWRPDDRLSAKLTDGEVGWFVTIARCDGEVAIDLVSGDDADSDGRYQLTPGGEAALGDEQYAEAGAAELPLLGFTDPLGLAVGAGWVTARGVAIKLVRVDSGDHLDQLDAVVGLGIVLDDNALAPVAGFLTHHLGDSAVARALDADADGAIEVGELRASATIEQLIGSDVDLDGNDGRFDRVSLGFTLHARAVRTE